MPAAPGMHHRSGTAAAACLPAIQRLSLWAAVLRALLLTVALSAGHYAALMVLVEVFKLPRSTHSGTRVVLAACSIALQSACFVVWLRIDTDRWQSTLARAWCVGWTCLFAWVTVMQLRPQYGNLTQEEYLFYYSAGMCAGFYLTWGLLHGFLVLAGECKKRLVRSGSVVAAPSTAAVPPRQRAGLTAVAVLTLWLLVHSFGVGDSASSATSVALQQARLAHPMLRGILGEVWDPCAGRQTVHTLPTPWPSLLPRRVMNFWVGSEYCDLELEQRGAAFTPLADQSFPRPPSPPPMSFLDERTGVLLVRATCEGLVRGADGTKPPRVIAIDMASNQLGDLTAARIGGAELDELLPIAEAYHSDVAAMLQGAHPRDAQGGRFVWRGAKLRVTEGKSMPVQPPFPKNNKLPSETEVHPPVADAVVEYVLDSHEAVAPSDVAAELERRVSRSTDEHKCPFSTMMQADVATFTAAVEGQGFFVVPLVTAHAAVVCGAHHEHHAYPVDFARRVAARVARGPQQWHDPKTTAATSASTNLVIIIADAVGRPTFDHYLPSTTAWLKGLHQRQSAKRWDGEPSEGKQQQQRGRRGGIFEFPGMTTVGHSTAPNVGTMWTGLGAVGMWNNASGSDMMFQANLFEALAKETVEHREPASDPGAIAESNYVGDRFNAHEEPGLPHRFVSSVIDGMCSSSLPYHAKNLHGYRTQLYRERGQRVGSSFGSRLGTIDDHFMGPLCDGRHYGAITSNFRGPYSMRPRCFGRGTAGRLLFEYHRAVLWQQRRLQQLEDGTRTISVLTMLDGHEGSRALLRTVDDALRAHLFSMEAMGVFNDSAVVLMSDHGNHMGPMHDGTQFGLMERMMPVSILSVPPGLVESNARVHQRDILASLATNQKANIVTPFDLHATMRDLLGVPPLVLPKTGLVDAFRIYPTPGDAVWHGNTLLPFATTCPASGRCPFFRKITNTQAGQSLLGRFRPYTKGCSEGMAQETCAYSAICFGW